MTARHLIQTDDIMSVCRKQVHTLILLQHPSIRQNRKQYRISCVRTNSALFIIYLEKIKLLSKPVFKNFISNKVQNDVWIAVFMQLFLVALDKIIFRG